MNRADTLIDDLLLMEKKQLTKNLRRTFQRAMIQYFLYEYNNWLLENGYSDTDIVCEMDINDFLQDSSKIKTYG